MIRYPEKQATETPEKNQSRFAFKNEGGWTDFFTHIHYQGGQYIDYPLTLETIPVFIKEKP